MISLYQAEDTCRQFARDTDPKFLNWRANNTDPKF